MGIDNNFKNRFDVLFHFQSKWARFDASDDKIRSSIITPVNMLRLITTTQIAGTKDFGEKDIDMTRWNYEVGSVASTAYSTLQASGEIKVALNEYRGNETLLTVTMEQVDADVVSKCLVHVRNGQAMVEVVAAIKTKSSTAPTFMLDTSVAANNYTVRGALQLNRNLPNVDTDRDYGAS